MPKLDDINIEYLVEQRQHFELNISDGIKADAELCKYALATEIICAGLGPRFLERNNPRLFAGDKNTFLSPADSNQSHMQRYEFLANAIYRLRSESGFKDWLQQKENDSFESVFYELQAASMFKGMGASLEFKSVSSGKGRDYEFDVFFNEEKFCVEVKSKYEETEPSIKSFKESLEKACKQIPEDEKNILMIYVPDFWFKEIKSFPEEFEKLLGDFFRRHTRVNYIFLGYFQMHSLEGSAFAAGHFLESYKNPLPKIIHQNEISCSTQKVPGFWDDVCAHPAYTDYHTMTII